MNPKAMLKCNSLVTTFAVVVGASFGILLWQVVKCRKRRKTERVQNGSVRVNPNFAHISKEDDDETSKQEQFRIQLLEQLLQADCVVVSSEKEWQHAYLLLKKELEEIPVLGIDCEWDQIKGILKNELDRMNKSILEDLFQQYEGLRNSIHRGLGLKSLAQDILNLSLDKSLRLRCSNWEAEELSNDQVIYAARDAQVSVALFLQLVGLMVSDDGASSSFWKQDVMGRCQGLIDIPFKGKADVGEDMNGEVLNLKKKATNVDSQISSQQQGADPRKHKRKPLGVGYSARKSPLYDNCFLYAPDGQPLCTCDRKKAQWYLDKGIGELLTEDPFVVKLMFEPSGRPESEKDYYLNAKENLCVVCGKRESYIRKNIVPHEYRRHFPVQMKDHNSHDVLLLCTSCHAASNYYDNILKQRLAEEFGAPIGCEEGVRLLEDPVRRQVRSGARALLNSENTLPISRREELLAIVKDFCKTEHITEDILQEAAGLETRIFNELYVPHGLKVVQLHAKDGLLSLMQLEKRWRQHFLETMQPKYLPLLWSVEHNHNKLIRKYGKDLQIILS
ncbi:exonuclease 3'-5' domain-containing protein 2 [Protopterus annectens]|uniref:exonuclease 3'-5' domain-containing protein 2 n=1 Tax=Protopterus annectens TaxID=7888 RepID=UPI001CFB6644|nr:exonuclease 3'-5' domain-containing protein 2 [Protopterus annectens]